MTDTETGWSDCLQHAVVTDIGMRRSNNQDAYSIILASDNASWQDRGHIFVVADGMGAHAAGELASRLAVDGIPHTYYRYRDKSPPEAILRAVRETNGQINSRGQANTDFRNMGTTASVLLLLPQGALAAHVGDSRIYRLRGDQLEQLTFDHSLLWEMRAAGQIPKGDSDITSMIPKNVITRSLGPHPTVQVDLEGPLPVQLDDTFLLCSDGLTGKVQDEELGPILSCLEPQLAAQVLVDLANLRGGPDNVTVIVAKVTGPRLTTGAVRVAPLRLGGDELPRRIHPVFWLVIAVCGLASLFMLVAGQPIPALLAGVGAVIAATVGILQKFGTGDGGTILRGRKLGRGPHVRITCPPNADFVQSLDQTGRELRAAAVQGKWEIDFSQFDESCQKASEEAGRGEFAGAIRQFGYAITFMMQELRSQRGRKTRDTTIDYT